MSTGTITLTNRSAIVGGSGTSFATELVAGDFIVSTVGGVPYTLPVKTVDSNTRVTLVSNFTGPTQAGAAWSAIPRVALNMVTTALVAQSAEALRGLNYDKQNWQQVFSADGNITVKLPDGTTFTGPSWKYLSDNMATKSGGAVPVNQGGTGATTAEGSRTNLGLGSSATKNVGTAAGNVMEVGAFGFGGKGNSFYADTVAEVWENLMDKGSCVFRNNKAVKPQTAYAASLYFAAGDTHAVISVAYGSGVVGVLARNTSGTSATSTFNMLYGTANTTCASDGTLKAASPVVAIFSDGSYRTNDESEGCTVTRLSTGQYLIEGCQGMNADAAWGGIDGGFDIPTDRNKQPLIWLDYEVNADGSVLVKTHHREHPSAPAFARNERDGLADGEPVDIPSDQFVSVRVEMPADSIWNQKQLAAKKSLDDAHKLEANKESGS